MISNARTKMATAALAITLAACADQPTAVKTPTRVAKDLASRAPSLTVTGGPNLSDWLTFQGEVWICKDGNQPGTTFAIDYSVVRTSDNTQVAAGTVNVPLGQCVLATSINTQVNGRYRASATEQAPPANWSLTAIDWAYGANLPASPPAPTVDLATRTISAVLIANDVGVQLTFTNTFTPPPPSGELGDFVWNDANTNGIQDSGEQGLAGLLVTLGGAANATTTTDVSGHYLFSGLSAGNYTVTVATPGGYTASPSGQGSDPTVDSNGSPASVTLATNSSSDLSIDFGFYVTPPPPAGCTYTQGYWKNHASAWPVTSVTLGTVTYTQAQLLKIFGTPVRGNGLVSLAHQLIAAKLNIASGAAPSAVSAAITAADALIGSKVVPSVGTGSLSTSATSALTTTLDNYNNGVSGPGHC